MRVSLRNQYSNFLYNLQDTQSKLMDLNMQASSQKRINRPSDDPVGTARVLNYRSSLASIDQYRSNIDTAKGWLGLADESMIQVSTILTKLKGLAEQGASGTMTASDREATSYEVRQLFSQLVNLGNTRFEGKSIFGGQKFEGSAFEEALMVYDQDGKSLGLVTGQSSRSIAVQFLGAGPGPVDAAGGEYRYSKDGGTTWTKGTVGADGTLDLGGIDLNLGPKYQVWPSPETNVSTETGSWLTIAPTAVYKGDHESQSAVVYTAGGLDVVAEPLGGFERDVRVTVVVDPDNAANLKITATPLGNGAGDPLITSIPATSSCVVETPYGTVSLSGTNLVGTQLDVKAGSTGVLQMGSTINAEGRGLFDNDVMVRINKVDFGDSKITYKYSTDGGTSWSDDRSASLTGTNASELLVPGGKLVLTNRPGASDLKAGDQFVIHPQTAAHNVEISAGQYLQLNNIGAEIFGGYYENGTQPVFSDSDVGKNIMVTVGKLVAALENNNQQGCAEALDGLKAGHQYFTTQLASVGARENRLDVADTVLSGLKLNETERMSNVEDADLATLLTELANQQLSYEAVLKSSSMIMKMSLVNYL
ncbi:flagellar hook-associated protein 3 FlgL [Desulfomicrobium apsheronum]|uniref:Flagellar hook-associated protein 3 FlgL n=1 Tax=Desulfomicrobium apsheronum TaxID=52560 RepID=A0A1I3U5J7_9BACT|nr:flagellar hook-associated protein FlgL [Desulfomicrobium apsheronum]SFJ77849.1 flagellar hook-associated protein 3 FlgL [Desulfomicrobium apsheronum]